MGGERETPEVTVDMSRRLPPKAVILAGLFLVACTGKVGDRVGVGAAGSGPSGPGPSGSGKAGSGPSVSGTAGSSGGGAGVSGQATVLSRVGLAARLSKFEYQNSVADVLGVALLPAELDAAAGGIPDDTGDGVLKHLADKQTSVEQHALAYFQVADGVAKRADMAALSTRLGTCTKDTADCGAAFVRAVGRLLFRRPLEQRETDAMLVVYNAALGEKLAFAEAARWALRALLQAPQFLFRMDKETSGVVSQPRELDGYELAALLSSFLWVSVPDEELLTTAGDGSLVTPEILDEQVKRMLADPKARRLTEVFATDFSRARFASFEGATDADRAALNESVIATFQDHFWTRKGSIADLFTTTRFVVNPTVAGLLGLSMTGTGLQTVDVAANPQRVGLMSHPGMIAGMGDRVDGVVRQSRQVPDGAAPVPESGRRPRRDVAAQIETFNADTTGLNEHEKSAIRMTRSQCWSCHTQFEPLAFGFSRFDGAGRYVGEKDADGKPLPLDGWVPTGEAQEPRYTDMASYMRVLATNPVIQTCMTEHFIEFATARSSDALARQQAESVGQEYLASGSTLSAMVSAVVKSPLFRTVLPSPLSPAGSQAMRKLLPAARSCMARVACSIGLPFLEEMRPRAARAADRRAAHAAHHHVLRSRRRARRDAEEVHRTAGALPAVRQQDGHLHQPRAQAVARLWLR